MRTLGPSLKSCVVFVNKILHSQLLIFQPENNFFFPSQKGSRRQVARSIQRIVDSIRNLIFFFHSTSSLLLL